MSLPAKDPNSTEPYFIIWCDEDGTNSGAVDDTGELQGATITTVTWTVPPGITEVTHNQQTVTIHGVVYPADTVTTIWLSGGTDGVDYELNCQIVTSDSQILDKAITIPVRARPGTILSQAEAANVLRCEPDDPNMLDLLPLVDRYVYMATGRDWSQDVLIRPEAKAAARILLVQWHEDPGMMTGGQAVLSAGLSACLAQLEAMARYYYTFEGLEGAGYIPLEVKEGDTVVSLTGRVGATGDQSAKFESVITWDGYLQQTSSEDLSEKWYTAYIKPPQEM